MEHFMVLAWLAVGVVALDVLFSFRSSSKRAKVKKVSGEDILAAERRQRMEEKAKSEGWQDYEQYFFYTYGLSLKK